MSEDTAANQATPPQTTLSDSLVEQANAIATTDLDQARVLAQKATEADPSSSGAWHTRGLLARSANRLDEAVEFLAKAAELEPGSVQAWLSLADAYAAAGDPAKAADAYRQAVHLDSGNRDAWFGLAQKLASNAELTQALSGVTLSASDQAAVWYQRGRALQVRGDNRSAVDAFENALPNLPADMKVAALYLQAVSLNELPDPKRALDTVAQAEQFNLQPDDRGLLLLEKGKALLAGGQPDAAIKDLTQAATLVASDIARSNCWLQIGVAHNSRGEYTEAVAAFDRSIAAAPSGADTAQIRIIAAFNKAAAEYQLSDQQRALEALQAALDDFARYPAALPLSFKATLLLSKANILSTLGNFKEASAALHEAEEANPALGSDLQFWVMKTNTCFFAGDAQTALRPPPPEIADHPLVLATRGTIQKATGDFSHGQEELSEAAARAPKSDDDDPLAWVGVGLAELALFHWQPAAAALEKARDHSPQLKADSSISYSLGVALLALERYREAWEALQGLPETRDTLQAQASALLGLGNTKEAAQTMERVSLPGAGTPFLSVLSYWLWLGNMLLALDRSSEALKAFETARKMAVDDPKGAQMRVQAAVGYASALIKLDRRDEALESLSKFTKEPIEPGSARPGGAWWMLGALLAEKERFEEALRAVNFAHELEPENGDILLGQGRALFNLQDYQRSEEVFEQALGLARNHSQNFEALVGAGNALNGLDLYEKAIDRFRQALRIASEDDRKDSRVWSGLGNAYLSLGRFEAAHRTFREGWNGDPVPKKSTDLALGVADALNRQERRPEATDFLKTARNEAARTAGAKIDDILQKLLEPGSGPGDLTSFWFGAATPGWRKAAGVLLAVMFLAVALLPVIGKDAIHWLNAGDNYKTGWITLLAVLFIFLAPLLKSIKFNVKGVEVELTAPSATAQPDWDKLLHPRFAGSAISGQLPSGPDIRQTATAAATKEIRRAG